MGVFLRPLVEADEFELARNALLALAQRGIAELIGHGVTAVRGAGLWAGIDIDPTIGTARDVCMRLLDAGILAKDTHGQTVRLAPPIVIEEADLDMLVREFKAAVGALAP